MPINFGVFAGPKTLGIAAAWIAGVLVISSAVAAPILVASGDSASIALGIPFLRLDITVVALWARARVGRHRREEELLALREHAADRRLARREMTPRRKLAAAVR